MHAPHLHRSQPVEALRKLRRGTRAFRPDPLALQQAHRGATMKPAVDIRFAGLRHSYAIEIAIRGRVRHIERLCHGILAWRITVEQAREPRHRGRPFDVRVDVTLPGDGLVATRVHDENVYAALRDAFDAVRRQVEARTRNDRGRVRAAVVHAAKAAAVIPTIAAAATPPAGTPSSTPSAAAVLRLILLHSRALGHAASAAQAVGIWPC